MAIWQDLESCFEDCNRIEAIIYLSGEIHYSFLEKARKSCLLKVKKELQKFLLKVNVYQANFIKPHTGETEITHFQTENIRID